MVGRALFFLALCLGVGSVPLSKAPADAAEGTKGAGDKCRLHMGLESPCFEIVTQAKEYEIRRYEGDEWWSTSTVAGPADWAAQTKEGFMNNFQYIGGDNTKAMKIPMSSPVLTTRKLQTGELVTSFFLTKDANPPPSPGAQAKVVLKHDTEEKVFAVISFPGWADGHSFTAKEEELKNLLARDGIKAWDGHHSWLAQYDPPFMPVFRHNEVWVPVNPGKMFAPKH